MKRYLILYMIIYVCTLPLFAQQETSGYQLSIPLKTSYVVGFSSLTGNELSAENQYLLKSIPLLLIEELELLKTHTWSEEQKLEYRKYLIRSEIIKFNKTRDTYKAEMDKLVFEKLPKALEKKRRKELQKSEESVLLKIMELKALDPGQITVPDELPIEFKQGSRGKLLDPPAFSPLQFQMTNNVDLLFYGKVEEIHGYIYVELRGVDGILKENVFYYKEIVLAENLYTLIPGIRKKLIKLVLGRDWSTILINPVPADAFVFVNDTFAGIGATVADYIKPGRATIKVTHPHYFEQQGIVDLKPYEEIKFEVAMEKIELGSVSLISIPTGARVYINSTYSGITSLDIERAYKLKRIILKSDDYDDYFLHIGHLTENTVTVELVKSLISPVENQKNKRDSFYTAFGLWLISIPFPIFLNGFAGEYEKIAANSDYDGSLQNRYNLMSDAFYVAYWVTLGITSGLFVNMGFNLRTYIISADRPIG